MTSKPSPFSLEEKWNTYSHALGILLGIIGLIILLLTNQEASQTPALTVYGLSVILLFSASTLYHAMSNPDFKQKLRIVDHISIYYLIAGTYTPVCLFVLIPSKGLLLLYLVWGIAILGTILKLFFTGKLEAFSLILYAVMGWIIIVDLQYLIESMSTLGLFYLALGGAFYTIGILFYAIKKIPFNHLIWHLFVLGGAISHWCLIYFEILQGP